MAIGDKYHGLTYREVLGISRLAYRNTCSAGLFYKIPVDNSIWEIVKVDTRLDYSDDKNYSFRAIIIRRKGDFKNKILSFSGSDMPTTDWGDWMDNFLQGYTGDSPQYKVARELAGIYKPNLIVGHSLGGGLASAAAVHTGIKTVTVNPAPLNVKANGQERLNKAYDKVINLVVKGEALDLLQDLSYNAMISEKLVSQLAEFIPLAKRFPKFKTTSAIPYMRRVGKTEFINSTASDIVGKHVLDYMVGLVDPAWVNGRGI